MRWMIGLMIGFTGCKGWYSFPEEPYRCCYLEGWSETERIEPNELAAVMPGYIEQAEIDYAASGDCAELSWAVETMWEMLDQIQPSAVAHRPALMRAVEDLLVLEETANGC